MAASQLSFSIWPPSDRTRAAVVERMEKTLSSPSILTKKYGEFDAEEAHAVVKRIEEEAFTASQNVAGKESDDTASHVLQFYSKEISTRMFEAAKKHASNQSPLQDNNNNQEGTSSSDAQTSDS